MNNRKKRESVKKCLLREVKNKKGGPTKGQEAPVLWSYEKSKIRSKCM